MDTIAVNSFLIQALDGLRLNLSHYYLLMLAAEDRPISFISPNVQTLERKGYMNLGQLTTEGVLLYQQLNQERARGGNEGMEIAKRVKKAVVQADEEKLALWTKWWAAYPASTTWISEDGRQFHGGRSLRTNKQKCEEMFYKILDSLSMKNISPQRLIDALEYDVRERKKKSLSTGKNMMDSFQGSPAYLNQCTFEAVWDMMEADRSVQQYAVERPKTVDTTKLF